MPHSMTGFAAASRVAEPFQINWEIRSVNNRFLDLGFRLPEELRSLETTLRDDAAARISRGKVDCTMRLNAAGAGAIEKRIDHAMVTQLRRWHEEITEDWPGIAAMSTADLLRWPGILKDPEVAFDALAGPAREAFGEALDGLVAARAREGERIAALLGQRLEGIRELLATIAPRLAGTADRHRAKLRERLGRLDIEAQPERLEQEIALIAQRLDVSEETDRLKGHVAELADILTRPEPVGRRLDFLIQELNREANTLGSKVQDEDLTRAAVDLKVLIEQMREQVQNLE